MAHRVSMHTRSMSAPIVRHPAAMSSATTAEGRFVGLANAGHPASARHALWMCEQGPAQFGKDWDCAPHEVEDGAMAASVAVPRTVAAQAMPAAVSKAPVRR